MNSSNYKFPLLCLAALFGGSFIVAPFPTSAGAVPQSGSQTSPLLSPIILTDSWPIKKVKALRSGTLAFAGGDFMTGADGLLLIGPTTFVKLAAQGDPVPGHDGMFLVTVGVTEQVASSDYDGDFSLNDRDELAFTAKVANCGSAAQITQCAGSSPLREGLFLFSEKSRTTIALEGDPVPDLAGWTFQSFCHVWLTNKSTVAFTARIGLPDGHLSVGFFSYSQTGIERILIPGETTSFGLVQNLPSTVFPNDDGSVIFDDWFSLTGTGIYRHQNGVLSKILSESDPAPWGGTLGTIWEWNAASRGEFVVNARDKLYLRGGDGSLSIVVKAGDSSPIGGQFGEFVLSRQSSFDPYMAPVEPQVDGSGDVMFKPLNGQGLDGIFLISRGTIENVVADFEPLPGYPLIVMTSPGFDMNNLGVAAFSATIGTPAGLALFSYSKGNVFSIFLPGGEAPLPESGAFKDLKEFFVDDTGAVLFHTTLCCGRYKEGIFRASYPHAAIPNGSFETLGDNGMPAGWQLTWTNSGSGDVRQYNCGTCALDGLSVLRLHVGAGGGSVFVVSDPIPVTPSGAYMVSGQMRYQLNSANDAVWFTIIQMDSAGNMVDLTEVQGVKSDNTGDWVPKGMLIRTKPSAASVRIRIGLTSATETTLDVDSVR
jgi:hypothetical protein